ncbi:MAG: arginine--tRNA ligase [Christensenellaceae bacterium]|nr:arginine--tRNA ligase [Christensenellaceae bacterium]
MDYLSELAAVISKCTGLSAAETEKMIEIPPNPEMGDFALPCFKLSRTLRKAPPAIAADLKEKIELPSFVERMEVAGGYLNFFIDKTSFIKGTVEKVVLEGERYGSSDMGKGGNVVMDYSSINIAKPFHIGHLSSTAIGNSLYRIYNFLGYNSIGVNHLGDWGTQFGKMIVAYKMWGDKELVEKESVRGLVKLYVRFHQEAEENEALNDEARAWFRKIEQGDEEAVGLFEWFKEITMKEVLRVYDMLDVHFDSYAGESFYEDKMQPVVDELKEKGLLKLDQGASIVDLSEYNMPPCIILRSDGATLYATRDLATAIYRKDTYDFVKSLYVVAYQQNLHFKQFFKVLELMGRDWVKDCEHVNFGMVSIENGSLSTRHGNVVYLEDVLNASIVKTLDIINEKSPDLEDKEETAKAIGVGALVFSTLSAGRIKDIVFDLDRVLNFDGETGPYVQYTRARALSVIRKSEGKYDNVEPDWSALNSDEAFAVCRLLYDFPSVIVRAMEKNEPSIITRHIVLLSQAFNRFYYDHRIIDEDENATAARLKLAYACATVIKTGLYLLGIKAPDRM